MATKPTLKEIGRCNFRDEAGALWCAVSYGNESTGEVTTQDELLEPAPEPVTE